MKISDPVTALPFIGPAYAQRLEKLEIKTIDNLLHHIPHRYIDFSHTTKIAAANPDELVTIKGKVLAAKNQYTRTAKKIQVITVADASGEIEVIFFNQPYLTNTLAVGSDVSLGGKVGWWGRKKALIAPEFERAQAGTQIHTGRLIPIYPETAGISSKWLRRVMTEAFDRVEVKDWLPPKTIKDYQLPSLPDALAAVHFPQSLELARGGRQRLAFDELLLLHLAALSRKKLWQKNKAGYNLKTNRQTMDQFLESLPFILTNAQKRVIGEITQDLSQAVPMNRLLEGDVGSGKTIVAAAGIYAAFTNGFQSVLMAPTQILAQQHYQTLSEIFAPFKVRLSYLTSAKRVADAGRTDVFIGTHALIHKNTNFENVALVVIDEQHKFGVEQRNHLIKKSGTPHVLTMTATPIPRTIAQTLWGDLDLSILDELPSGRAKITTWLVPPQKREGAYKWIKSQIKSHNSQAYIVCPLIEESAAETLKDIRAVKKEFERLTKVFKNFKVGLLHGKLKSKEKEEQIEKFRKGKTDILVTTPVVEVGIDVPKATIMVIEGAERFGLAQLHQLRGRVGRGKQKSYCLVMTAAPSVKALTRLHALTQTMSGFELAELDLKLRGPGEVFGTKQSGFPELKIASWQDTALIIQTKKAARELTSSIKLDKQLPQP